MGVNIKLSYVSPRMEATECISGSVLCESGYTVSNPFPSGGETTW